MAPDHRDSASDRRVADADRWLTVFVDHAGLLGQVGGRTSAGAAAWILSRPAQGHRPFLKAQVTALCPDGAGIAATVAGPAGEVDVRADLLLICTGRRPNTDLIDAAAGGLTLDEHGHVVTDEAYRTGVPGVWALGDVANHFQLKHMANAEVRVVAHNLQHPGAERGLTSPVAPHAVFGRRGPRRERTARIPVTSGIRAWPSWRLAPETPTTSGSPAARVSTCS